MADVRILNTDCIKSGQLLIKYGAILLIYKT